MQCVKTALRNTITLSIEHKIGDLTVTSDFDTFSTQDAQAATVSGMHIDTPSAQAQPPWLITFSLAIHSKSLRSEIHASSTTTRTCLLSAITCKRNSVQLQMLHYHKGLRCKMYWFLFEQSHSTIWTLSQNGYGQCTHH